MNLIHVGATIVICDGALREIDSGLAPMVVRPMTVSASPQRLLVLVASPRRDGNSAMLGAAVVRGAQAAGSEVSLAFIDDHLDGLVRDCRECRDDQGRCRIEDGFGGLFLDRFLPADGVALCTPVYWYGMSGQAKVFFDRMFCYFAKSHAGSAQVRERIKRKRVALLTSSEEIYPAIALGIVHQLQEYARYTHSRFIGTVHGWGNGRGEVMRDPQGSVAAAEALGREFFERPYLDLQMDTVR
ncbi:flavodoxin family protein [Lysobacter capsici]|uniref:flavodoxin family protein n=1 Tax=Lysobacter capsici TaxID=435897 RepID=UPI0019100B2D|nr:flavodoxin family protein [Lysobacter capsici]